MKSLIPFFLGLFIVTSLAHTAETQRVDVCVYGATPSGIVAAVTAKQ